MKFLRDINFGFEFDVIEDLWRHVLGSGYRYELVHVFEQNARPKVNYFDSVHFFLVSVKANHYVLCFQISVHNLNML